MLVLLWQLISLPLKLRIESFWLVITQSDLTSPTEAANIVHSLKNSKCEGFDVLCISPIKDTIDLIAAPLTHICNLSFSQGVFPDKLKTTKILPIFKCDDSSLFSNYRPISILPCLSKVFEKLFTSDCLDFLKNLTFLVTINMASDHIILQLWLSSNL